MSKHQWLIFTLTEIILVSIAILFPSRETLVLFIIMQVHFIIIRKAKVIIKDGKFKNAIILRRTIYFLPYIFSFCLVMPKELENSHLFVSLISSPILGLCFLIPNINELRPYFNRELMSFLPPVSVKQTLIEIYSYVGSAILQELFYKAFVIAILYPLVGVVAAIIISAFFFVAEHVVHFVAQKTFCTKDYILQFVLSACGGVIYIYSGSVLVAMLLHLTYNIPIALTYIVRLFMQKTVK